MFRGRTISAHFGFVIAFIFSPFLELFIPIKLSRILYSIFTISHYYIILTKNTRSHEFIELFSCLRRILYLQICLRLIHQINNNIYVYTYDIRKPCVNIKKNKHSTVYFRRWHCNSLMFLLTIINNEENEQLLLNVCMQVRNSQRKK